MSQTSPPSRPELFYLVGTSGHPNFGDEFIAASWLRFLARRHPDVPVMLDCPKPGNATHLFAGMHPRLQTTDVLWRMVWETIDLSVDDASARVDHLVRNLGSPLYDYALLAIRRATRVHLIGGAHITHHWPFHVQLLRAALTLGEVAGAPVVATGLGLVPSAEPEFVRKCLEAFDHVSVRDEGSADLTGASLAPDDAFLGLPSLPAFDARPTAATPGEKGDVWVCLQRDLAEEGAFQANVAAVRRLLTGGLAEGRMVHYVEAIPDGDHGAFEQLGDLIPADNFVPFVRFWSEPFPAKPRQVWLTSRFHLHLLAAASGAAGVAFEIDRDSYRVKHSSLAAAGTGWPVVAIGDAAVPAPAGGHNFRVAARRMHRAKVLEAEQIYS